MRGATGSSVTLTRSSSANDSAMIGGTVTFASPGPFSVSTSSVGSFLSSASQSGDVTSLAATDLSTVLGAQFALSTADEALDSINGMRSGLGAAQNRLESAMSVGAAMAESWTAAESRIRDADFAQETAFGARAAFMSDASTSMLAQAMDVYNSVKSLLTF